MHNARGYQSIFPGKFSILFEVEQLLAEGRLPLAESGPARFPANANGEYRALWFTPDAPKEDRQQLEQYLYGWNGREKMVVDVNVHDGDAFFMELQRYFVDDDPVGRLQAIEVLTEKYRDALLQNFSVEDLLGDIGKERVNTLMQPNLSIMDLRSMPIPVPPIREQDRLTDQLSELGAETQRLASLYQSKLAALEGLKKSLLHQAFSGAL